MLNINSQIINTISEIEIDISTKRIYREFKEKIGQKPEVAFVIYGDGNNRKLIDSLQKLDINEVTYKPYGQFSIFVGSLTGSRYGCSNLCRPNPECEYNNLLPKNLQWENLVSNIRRNTTIPNKVKRYVERTISSNNKLNTKEITNGLKSKVTFLGEDKTFMRPTQSSLAKTKNKIQR